MMSPGTIAKLEREAGARAAKESMQPVVFWSAQRDWKERDRTKVPGAFRMIPNLGDHRPDGWSLVDEYLVDSTGFGGLDDAGGPAHSINSFIDLIVEHGDTSGWAVISQGQFQVVVGRFERVTDGA